MQTINSYLIANIPLIVFLLLTISFVYYLFRSVAKNQTKSIQDALYQSSLKTKQTELSIEYFSQLLAHISHIRCHYLIGYTQQMQLLGARFAEDISAAVELNNSQKEQQLSKGFRSEIKAKQRQLDNDKQKLEVVIEQFNLLAPKEAQNILPDLEKTAEEILAYAQLHLDQLNKMADDPFGTSSYDLEHRGNELTKALKQTLSEFVGHYQAQLKLH